MLFLIASSPDTKEFKTAYKTAQSVNAKVCLLQNAVYAARNLYDSSFYVMKDEMQLRGIQENEITGTPINYDQLIDLISEEDKVVGLF